MLVLEVESTCICSCTNENKIVQGTCAVRKFLQLRIASLPIVLITDLTYVVQKQDILCDDHYISQKRKAKQRIHHSNSENETYTQLRWYASL